MEEDRIATNLGPDEPEALNADVTLATKVPKRRFVGRRAAEKTATSSTPNDSIEESTAVQGVKSPSDVRDDFS